MAVSLGSSLRALWLFSLRAHFDTVLVFACASGFRCVWGVGWNRTLGGGWGRGGAYIPGSSVSRGLRSANVSWPSRKPHFNFLSFVFIVSSWQSMQWIGSCPQAAAGVLGLQGHRLPLIAHVAN